MNRTAIALAVAALVVGALNHAAHAAHDIASTRCGVASVLDACALPDLHGHDHALTPVEPTRHIVAREFELVVGYDA